MVDRSAFAVDENWKNRHKYSISNKQYLLQTYTHAIFHNIWGVLLTANIVIMTCMQRPFTVPLSCNRFTSGIKFYCWWFLLFSIVRHLACWFIAGIVSWHYLQIEKYHRNYLYVSAKQQSLVSEKTVQIRACRTTKYEMPPNHEYMLTCVYFLSCFLQPMPYERRHDNISLYHVICVNQ